jgi:hypothetical protein
VAAAPPVRVVVGTPAASHMEAVLDGKPRRSDASWGTVSPPSLGLFEASVRPKLCAARSGAEEVSTLAADAAAAVAAVAAVASRMATVPRWEGAMARGITWENVVELLVHFRQNQKIECQPTLPRTSSAPPSGALLPSSSASRGERTPCDFGRCTRFVLSPSSTLTHTSHASSLLTHHTSPVPPPPPQAKETYEIQEVARKEKMATVRAPVNCSPSTPPPRHVIDICPPLIVDSICLLSSAVLRRHHPRQQAGRGLGPRDARRPRGGGGHRPG